MESIARGKRENEKNGREKKELSRTEWIKMQQDSSSKALLDAYITKVFNSEKAYIYLYVSLLVRR